MAPKPGQLFDPSDPKAGITTLGWTNQLNAPQGTVPAPHNATAPSDVERITQGLSGTSQFSDGNGLLSTLSLPQGLNAGSVFSWQAHVQNQGAGGNYGVGPFMPDNNPNRSQLTQMTMAGFMSYLRELSVNNKDQYNSMVFQLVQAGYLTPQEARYGSFTTAMGNKFLQAATDVYNINQHGGIDTLLTYDEHLAALAKARIDAGQADANGNPLGSGGSGPQAPTRTDKFTNPDDVRSAIDSAARNILGRKLTDKEVAGFQSLFHAQEQASNNQVWSATMSAFNNQSSTPNTSNPVTAPPSPTASAENYMDHATGALGQERENQLLGSYVGVLRNMTGLGAGGVSRAVS